MDRGELIRQLRELPIVQYEFLETASIRFSERVRHICEQECERYGRSWSCPPAVGTVERCREKCLSYPEGLLLVTMWEVEDASVIEAVSGARLAHEEITRKAGRMLQAQGMEIYTLSTESCANCSCCTYPEQPCRHPERMYPCVEGHGILVTELAERYGIEYQAGERLVTWFSLILYR